MKFLGIDPGKNGGLALIDSTGNVIQFKPMPDSVEGLWSLLSQTIMVGSYAVLEQVGGYVGVPQPGSRMFEFGRSYGECLMGLTAAGISYRLSSPQEWQGGLGIVSPWTKAEKAKLGKKYKAAWKGFLVTEADRLFPKIKADAKTADALLIAEYARRSFT